MYSAVLRGEKLNHKSSAETRFSAAVEMLFIDTLPDLVTALICSPKSSSVALLMCLDSFHSFTDTKQMILSLSKNSCNLHCFLREIEGCFSFKSGEQGRLVFLLFRDNMWCMSSLSHCVSTCMQLYNVGHYYMFNVCWGSVNGLSCKVFHLHN